MGLEDLSVLSHVLVQMVSGSFPRREVWNRPSHVASGASGSPDARIGRSLDQFTDAICDALLGVLPQGKLSTGMR